MSKYSIIDRKNRRKRAEFLSENTPLLLPMAELIQQSRQAVDEVIDLLGRAHLEAMLLVSAQTVAGPKQQGKRRSSGPVGWHGFQPGIVALSDRKLRLDRPRLRGRGQGGNREVAVPLYPALQANPALSDRMLQIVLNGISTRKYREIFPAMAEAAGVSKSAVSREIIEGGQKVVRALLDRRFDDQDILIIYIDAVRFGDHHVIAAVGVDAQGIKHVLGVREGASENATVVKALLTELVEKGVKPGRRLFVIDGGKALPPAIDAGYGSANLVQRCRTHKERNVRDHLPKDLAVQTVSVMKAAWRLEAKEGEAQLEKQAQWLEREWPSAAASLREGLSEMFTINRLGIPATLRRCLGSTNIIESSFSGTRGKTYKVTHWQNGAMALRWAASALIATEKNFRKIIGAHQLWQLKAYLDEPLENNQMENRRKVG